MTQVNDYFDFSDAGILRYLQSFSGRLETFLLQVPTIQLRKALEEKERLEDLRYYEERNRGEDVFRYNVLDYTLEQVIKANYDEKIINYFEFELSKGSSRLQNHPQFGMRLVNLYPEKYYVGDHSSHINHAREIEELYGIEHIEESQQDSDENGSDLDKNEQEENEIPEQSNEQGAQISELDEEEFIVDDSVIQEEKFDEIDDLEAQLKQKRLNKNKKSTVKDESSSDKQQKSKTIRKLRNVRKIREETDSESESENHNKTDKKVNKKKMIIESEDQD